MSDVRGMDMISNVVSFTELLGSLFKVQTSIDLTLLSDFEVING